MILAQALAEKGALDGAITGVSAALSNLGGIVENRPWLLIVLAVVLFFLLKRKR